MAQKKVSVRLVAEGGRQVKAEFQGVGDAGEASFRRIERQADVTGAVLRRLAGIVAGALTYAVGLLITMVFNIPLNNDLAAIGGPSSITDPAAARAAFENVWVRWNLIRAVVHTVAFAALLVGLVTR